MTKKFILNIVLNVALIFLIFSGIAAYRSGNALFLGIAIAIAVVLMYLKVVLLKQVNRDAREKYEANLKQKNKGKIKKS